MIENMGLIQELKYKFNEKEWFKSALWIEHDWHQIQNAQPETLDNKHIRFWSEYENRKQPIHYKASFGYVNDMQLHKANENAKIGTQRLIGELEAKQDFNSQLGYKTGAKYSFIKPNVYAYNKNIIDYEQQTELYLSSFYMPWSPLKMTLNLRQQLVTNYNVPFTPSLGLEYRLFSNEFSIVKSTMSIGRSYRVPTFNDRFWPIVGNSNLKPEDGMNYELGLQYIFCSANFQTDLKLNAFYLDVKDWIEWSPASSGWEPLNKSRVVSKGIEISSNTDFFANSFHYNLRMNFSFNPTEIKDDTNTSLVGRQIIYVPKHLSTIYLNVEHKKWNISVDGTYTGERLANHSGDIYNPDGETLDAFYLINSGLSRNMNISKQKFNLLFSINNILNKSYYNQPGYAMWGRNFQFTLTTDLDFTKPK
jgi:iron complex outermembrane receptor protein